jgi:hypothetical protein
MERHPHELPIPGAAIGEEDACEVLRLWATRGKPRISIDTECCDDPGAWGIVLVDIARHIAVAHELSGKMKGLAVLEQIRRTFVANWEQR